MSVLKNAGLNDEFVSQLPCNQEEFAQFFQQLVDDTRILPGKDFASGIDKASSTQLFEGKVNHDGFLVRKKRPGHFFYTASLFTTAQGKVQPTDQGISVQITIIGLGRKRIQYYLLGMVMYLAFAATFYIFPFAQGINDLILLCIGANALFMVITSFTRTRKSVREMRSLLEKSFAKMVNIEVQS